MKEVNVKNTISREDSADSMDFQQLFTRTQKYMSKNYASFMSTVEKKKNGNIEQQMKNHIRQYLMKRKLLAEGYTLEETVDKLTDEMTRFSVLDQYLDPQRTDVEEVNINAWNDVKVTYSDGRTESVEHFRSPQHCNDIIRRLLRQEKGLTLDNSRPIVRGHLSGKIRITVVGGECIDNAVGLAASIRIVNPKNFKRQDFIDNGTTTEAILTLLTALFINGVSMCITGETGSGKTTIMSYLLAQVPYTKRLFTIEEDVREFNLIVKDDKGNVVNNVVHTVTKKSDDPAQTVDQEKLLETAMTMDPDFICVAEMKGKEALAAQEAANTGHTVITTTHARSCRLTYNRMASLCKNSNDSNEVLVEAAKTAFPIVVFIKKYDDNVRRIEEITECVIDEEGRSKINTLYRYEVREKSINENGKVHIEGEFVKKGNISEYLQKLLKEGTADEQTIKNIMEG